MFPVIETSQISALSPSGFLRGVVDEEQDERFRETMRRCYLPLAAWGTAPYDLIRFSTAAYNFGTLLCRALGNTAAKTALEIGCGNGMKSLAWSGMFGRYIGVDLNAGSIGNAQRSQTMFGPRHLEFHHANAIDFITTLEREGTTIDLLVLYAVVEHLTLEERREILALASRVYDAGGVVLLEEAPNRLSRYDGHSFQTPFIQWLPLEMMRDYALRRSPRDELRREIELAPDPGVALFRAGVGVSFHEFELFWPGFDDAVVASDGFEPEMLNMTPLVPDDLLLLDWFEETGATTHRLFAKHYLSAIFGRSLAPIGRRARRLPLSEVHHGSWSQRERGWTLAQAVLTPSAGRLVLPPTQDRVLLSLGALPEGELVLEQDGGAPFLSYELGWLGRARLPNWHDRTTIELPPLPEGAVVRFAGAPDAQVSVFDLVLSE